MSPHAYTEDQLVEQPAIGLFSALGWQTMSALEETFGSGSTLGRETKSEAQPKRPRRGDPNSHR
jgi:type I restriction enzyme R subunit